MLLASLFLFLNKMSFIDDNRDYFVQLRKEEKK